MARTVRVELGERSYDVQIAPGMLDLVGKVVGGLGNARQAVVISAEGVPEKYQQQAVASLDKADLLAESVTFSSQPTSEASKTLATAEKVIDDLFAITPAIDRDCVLVAVGGGVVGDIVGFVAAIALRGLRFVQCPTTLLADVDSSVGGKTGVNHPAGKNLIGAFHQPRAVIIDVDTLKTLTVEELRNGLAECVKHAVIRDAPLLEFIEENSDAIMACDGEAMGRLIARNVEIKAAVVAADERESGERSHLNFGHTIGHAIEAFIGYDGISHGRAVALGMVAANEIAQRRGLIEAVAAERIRMLLERLGLPVSTQGLDAEEIWRIMQHDKKSRGGQVRMVLPTGPGRVDIFADVSPKEVCTAVAAIS
ncbi:MAG: 3-dehydroquinate synthase [Planctomycetota bacterium]|jgi:3-dehydroquinate synthase